MLKNIFASNLWYFYYINPHSPKGNKRKLKCMEYPCSIIVFTLDIWKSHPLYSLKFHFVHFSKGLIITIRTSMKNSSDLIRKGCQKTGPEACLQYSCVACSHQISQANIRSPLAALSFHWPILIACNNIWRFGRCERSWQRTQTLAIFSG